MKKFFICTVCFFICAMVTAQTHVFFHYSGNIYSERIENIDSISFPNTISIVHNHTGEPEFQFPISGIDSITFSDEAPQADTGNIVYIIYNNDEVTIINPYANAGLEITTDGAAVVVNDTSGIRDITYHLSGSTDNGSLTMSNDKRFNLIFSGVSITNPSGPAIQVLLDVKVSVTLEDESYLADGSSHTEKAAFASKGQIIFSGSGTLHVAGNANHAIFSSDYVRLLSGNIIISNAVNDGIHGDYFQMYGGSVDITANSAGIDGDNGFIEINNGNVNITTPQNDGKSLKCDSTITINGGDIELTVSGAQAKGMKSAQGVILNGGKIKITASGGTVVTDNTPAYCTGIKSDSIVEINAGTDLTIQCTSTNNGGKGISADDNIIINGGSINITTAGNGATYTNTSNQTDSYASSCINSDGNIIINAGNITCSSSGTGAKCIKCDGTLTIGILDADNEDLTINATTSGERFLVSGSSGGGGGWPPGPGGSSGDYANPKAIKSVGNLTINSGTIIVNCNQSNEGGEGIESKAQLTINGGNLEIFSNYDDAINASNRITINGGQTYAQSNNNDGIDSNGDMYINGGLTISSGARAPEEGFDCDQNTFKITGGIIVGTGGATSNPSSSCTQKAIKYTGSAGNAICIYNSSNTPILTFQLPTFNGNSGGGGFPGGGGGSSMVMLFSDPAITTGSYTLKYGGTISGGTYFHGYYTGATYSGGSSKSFNVSSSVTTSVQ